MTVVDFVYREYLGLFSSCSSSLKIMTIFTVKRRRFFFFLHNDITRKGVVFRSLINTVIKSHFYVSNNSTFSTSGLDFDTIHIWLFNVISDGSIHSEDINIIFSDRVL